MKRLLDRKLKLVGSLFVRVDQFHFEYTFAKRGCVQVEIDISGTGKACGDGVQTILNISSLLKVISIKSNPDIGSLACRVGTYTLNFGWWWFSEPELVVW